TAAPRGEGRTAVRVICEKWWVSRFLEHVHGDAAHDLPGAAAAQVRERTQFVASLPEDRAAPGDADVAAAKGLHPGSGTAGAIEHERLCIARYRRRVQMIDEHADA